MGGTEWGEILGLWGWSAGNIPGRNPQSLEALWPKIEERCIGIKSGLSDAHWREKSISYCLDSIKKKNLLTFCFKVKCGVGISDISDVNMFYYLSC